jgi:DnaD/phage-associated family protein
MSIIRVRKDARYFTASNEPFIDKRLSWETRGLMGYLLTKPDQWQVRIPDLTAQGPAKLHKIRRMLAEARLYGYMNRIRVTLPDGTFDWITEVFESPSQNPNPSSSVRKSTSGQSTSGKPADIGITEESSTESLDINGRTALLAKLFQDNITMITPIMAEKLKDAAEEFTDSTWYAPAFGIAVENSARNWKYIYTVLKNWKEKGRDWKPVNQTYAKGKTNDRNKQSAPKTEHTESDRKLAEQIKAERAADAV